MATNRSHSVRNASQSLFSCTALGFAEGATRILSDISITVASGGPLVVLGPNGAGKTTLLKVWHGLLRPSEGFVRWHTPDARALSQAMVFQRPFLLRRSVLANIEYALRIQQVVPNERALRMAKVLADTGLQALAARPARLLSGGEQQRVALARAWALAPAVLFLDEPSANLDPAATRAVEDLIRRIAASGTKIILSTHDLAQAQRLAQEIVFVQGGRLLEHTPAAQFFTAPASSAAAAFVRGELFW